MSKNRQRRVEPLGEDRSTDRPVLPLPIVRLEAHTIESHSHFRAQLLYAYAGVLEAVTSEGAWTLPPQQALWIPPGVEHEVRCKTAVELHLMYVHPDASPALPNNCAVIAVTPLLRELILRVSTHDASDVQRHQHLIRVLLDEVEDYTPAPLDLPLPVDPRLSRITSALREDPADARSIGDWADMIGTSERTLARLFERELGMRLGEWRQRLRLQQAVTRLASGDPVTRVALDLGYQGPSAFIAMFRKALGTTPARYLALRGQPRSEHP